MADLSYVTRDTTQNRYVNPLYVHSYSPDIIRIFSFDFIRTFNDCPLSLLEVFLPPPPKKSAVIRMVAKWLQAHMSAYTRSL